MGATRPHPRWSTPAGLRPWVGTLGGTSRKCHEVSMGPALGERARRIAWGVLEDAGLRADTVQE